MAFVTVSLRRTGRLALLACGSLAAGIALLLAASLGHAAWASWRLPRADAAAAVRAAVTRGDFRVYAWEGNAVVVRARSARHGWPRPFPAAILTG